MEDRLPGDSLLASKRIAFSGKLGGLTKREASQIVRALGGIPLEKIQPEIDWIVLGADELPGENLTETLPEDIRQAIQAGRIETITETDFLQRIGLLDSHHHVKQLYTPAMLAQLINVSVRVVRRWHRLGLIEPVKEIHRLPYFDFQEVVMARKLAQWVAQGNSPTHIEQQLAELNKYLPNVERPLAQLSILVEGKQLLLRDGEGLIEPSGQLRMDFEALDNLEESHKENTSFEPTLLFPGGGGDSTVEEAVATAQRMEDLGELEAAIDWYRVALGRSGPNAELCFELAELLYRTGELQAARERYYMAVEIDSGLVEARANLGCVLAETGRAELAIAAFQGVLQSHEEYADVHYHLARALDEMERSEESLAHWQRYLQLAPSSPWADEATERIDAILSSR